MDLIDVGVILSALIAAIGAIASQRSANKAGIINTSVSGRLEAERGAYERARAFDVATIQRQDQELKELRAENEGLRGELSQVKNRLAFLENDKIPNLERQLYGNSHEPDDQE